MGDQPFVESKSMPDVIADLRKVEATAELQKQAIREMRAAFDAEVAPLQAQVDDAEKASRALREELTVLALTNVAAGAPKRFGGLTLREVHRVVVHDAAAVIAALAGVVSSKKKPVVKHSLDLTALRDVVVNSTISVPGVEVVAEYHIALDSVDPVLEETCSE